MDTTGDSARPVYLRVADRLRERFEPGARLPSTAALATEWGVARETVRAGVDVLRAEGLVSSWPGRGVYYRDIPVEAEPAVVDERPDMVLQLMRRLEKLEDRVAELERRGDSAAVEQSPR